MKRIGLYSLITLTATMLLAMSVSTTAAASSKRELNDRWNAANTLYNNGNYPNAIKEYESIVAEGYISDKLFYNLGNAYFRDNKLGKAILNYSKAQRLNPSDNDIEYNLAYATGLVKDRIDVMPDFVLNKWVRKLRHSLNSNQWAVASLFALAFALGCVLLYILSRRDAYRKTGFYAGIVIGVIFIITTIFSIMERCAFLNTSQGVVIQSSALIKSSPDASSSELFILHEGTIVDIGESFEEWLEITITDGNKGWINSTAIEKIGY